MDLPAHQLWQAALSELQRTLSRSSFDNWIRPARLVEVGPDAATLRADNPQVAATLRNRLCRRHRPRALESGRATARCGRHVIVERPDRAAPTVPATRTPEPIARQLTLTANSGLNPRYIFDTYIVGSSNRFAHAAAHWPSPTTRRPVQPALHLGRRRSRQDPPAPRDRPSRAREQPRPVILTTSRRRRSPTR